MALPKRSAVVITPVAEMSVLPFTSKTSRKTRKRATVVQAFGDGLRKVEKVRFSLHGALLFVLKAKFFVAASTEFDEVDASLL